ncbi:MAG: DsbA family protein [Candidatus Aenigmatarchaeota archaeon]
MNMQKIGTLVVGIIFLGSTVAYAMSFAFSNPQNQGILDPVKGNEDAKVTIVEYSSYTCSFCGEAEKTIGNILSNYTGDVKVVFKSFPTDDNSLKILHAAECANLQGKFWEYHNRLFNTELPISNDDLTSIAKEIGLDMDDFNNCRSLNSVQREVLNDRQEGIDKGVEGIPTFFINDKKVVGAQSYSTFKNIIERNL